MPLYNSIRCAMALAACACPGLVAAQASPYLPLDDPRLPLLEHLITRGDIADPSPMVRPFRRSDALRVLSLADSASHSKSGRLIRQLRESLADPPAEGWWRLEGRAGAESWTHARRDPLHPAGASGTSPYVELGLHAALGPLVAVTRPAIEPRLIKDPDWSGRKNLQVTGRQVEAYLSAQFKWFRLFYGQMDMNWGPSVLPGIGLSDYSYARPSAGFEVGTDRVGLSALAAQLQDGTDSLGQTVHRYFFGHRLAARLSRRLHLGLWETTVLAGADRTFDGRYRNPVSLLLLANEYGLGDDGNLLLGLDLDWRVGRGTRLQGQFALDDIVYRHRGSSVRNPDRWALTLLLSGPLRRSAAWRAYYTQASSLAFRAFNPFENLTDAGVGLGRNFADNDQLSIQASFPLGLHWLVSPELTLLRQGEGRINDPYPARGPARGNTPQIFIGVIERTYRAALGLTGRRGPLRLRADAGVHRVENAGHLSGRSKTRFEGRLIATLGLTRQGILKAADQ